MATLPLPSANYSQTTKNHTRRVCPHCGSDDIYRSRARGVIERHVVRALRFYPHRCDSCDRRFYLRIGHHEAH